MTGLPSQLGENRTTLTFAAKKGKVNENDLGILQSFDERTMRGREFASDAKNAYRTIHCARKIGRRGKFRPGRRFCIKN